VLEGRYAASFHVLKCAACLPLNVATITIIHFKGEVLISPQHLVDRSRSITPTAAQNVSVLQPWRTLAQRELAAPNSADVWLRTCYSQGSDGKHDELVKHVEMHNAVEDRLLNDANLYNFGANWQQVFDVIPELLSPADDTCWEMYQEMFTRAMDALNAYAEDGVKRTSVGPHKTLSFHERMALESCTAEDWSEGLESAVQQARVISWIALEDEEALESGMVSILFLDEFGRLAVSSFTAPTGAIIRLPSHVGEGPFARVVSMDVAEPEYQLPLYHIETRSLDGNTSPVYKLRFDYDFHLTKRDEVVNIHVDYTNLLGYWDNITDEPANKKRKRGLYSNHLSQDHWRSKIGKAKRKYDTLRKRQTAGAHDTTTTCAGNTFSANMKMYLYTDIEMEATVILPISSSRLPRFDIFQYAYYFSGTIVPPAVTGTYAYFSLESSAYLGLRITGNTRLQATTGRKKLLDTISYPGLAIKGIAAVGPTLGLYGEGGNKTRAGAKVNFGKAEVYWPQDDTANDKYQTLLGLNAETSAPNKDLIAPTFDAKVRVDATLDINVTPEANMGLRVGGKTSGRTPLVDAQLVGYVNSTLRFRAAGAASGGTTSTGTASYRYGVYLLFNLGYGAYASIKFFPDWASRNQGMLSIGRNSLPSTKIPAPSPVLQNLHLMLSKLSQPRSFHEEDSSAYAHDGAAPVVHNESSAMIMSSLLAKTADDDGLTDAANAATTAQLQCAGNTPDIRLPGLRLNYNTFAPLQVYPTGGPAGNFASLAGICTGVQKNFTKRSLANSKLPLTMDNDETRSRNRRNLACGSRYCTPTQDILGRLVGVPSSQIKLSCDEFPFASTEEGGDYLTTLQVNPTKTQITCVPAWQNTLQGTCISECSSPRVLFICHVAESYVLELLGEISTNVGYFERSTRGDQAVNWAKWGGSSNWLAAGSLGDGGGQPQRQALYPDQQPKHFGISQAVSEVLSVVVTLGWNYKHNFTHGLAQPQNTGDGDAWDLGTNRAESWDHVNPQTGTGFSGNNMDQIACAVNIFGQDEVFKTGFNGYCYNGESRRGNGFDDRPAVSRCRIEFSQPSNTKRSIGQFNGWDVTKITMFDDNPEGKD
ncbi:MAG: hypothetical protein Q9226_007250, partial [Calogaya cf. arnoldii]